MEDSCFTDSTIILDLPGVTFAVVDEFGGVVAFVEVLEDCR